MHFLNTKKGAIIVSNRLTKEKEQSYAKKNI